MWSCRTAFVRTRNPVGPLKRANITLLNPVWLTSGSQLLNSRSYLSNTGKLPSSTSSEIETLGFHQAFPSLSSKGRSHYNRAQTPKHTIVKKLSIHAIIEAGQMYWGLVWLGFIWLGLIAIKWYRKMIWKCFNTKLILLAWHLEKIKPVTLTVAHYDKGLFTDDEFYVNIYLV